MNAAVRAYLDAARAALVARNAVPIARLVLLRPDPAAIGLVSPELDALLNGHALDLLPPAGVPDEVVAWQDDVRDWLLRATVAPLGDLGWITVVDEDRQHARFHAAPQLRALVGGTPVPQPIDAAKLAALLAEDPARALALAPASFDEAAIAAVAEALATRGRLAGAIALELVENPAWWSAPPPPTPDDFFEITITATTLRLSPGRGSGNFPPTEIPIERLFEIYPASTPDGQVWLRLWGCFDDHAFVDVGPVPAPIAGEIAARLRAQIGLPRPIDAMMSTRALVGREVQQWVEVLGTWTPGPLADAPDFDGLHLRLPPGGVMPRHGARLKVRGLFLGPATLHALQWERA